MSTDHRQTAADVVARARSRPGDGALPARDRSDGACSEECQQALERLEAFLDGELADDDVGRVADHLTACYPCTDRVTFESELRALIQRSCADTAPPDLVDRIRTRLAIDLDGPG